MAGGAVGGGGAAAAPKRAQSGTSFMGYLGGTVGSPTSPPIAGPQTAPPVLISPNALEAAKQTIQQRIFGGGANHPGGGGMNRRPATWQPQNSYSTASIFQPPQSAGTSPFKMLQQQYQQRCLDQDQIPNPNQRTSFIFTPPPSPQFSPGHAFANANSSNRNIGTSNSSSGNSNRSSNSHSISNNANYNYNINSRSRPFNHNQAQDTPNTNASAARAAPSAVWLKCKSWRRLKKVQRNPTRTQPPQTCALCYVCLQQTRQKAILSLRFRFRFRFLLCFSIAPLLRLISDEKYPCLVFLPGHIFRA